MSKNNDYENIDSLHLYLKEIEDYPLLNEDEEKQLTDELGLVDNISFIKKIKVGSTQIRGIDLQKLFLYLVNSSVYSDVISLLIDFYKNSNMSLDKKNLEQLVKYQNYCKKNSKAPDIETLKNDFDVDSDLANQLDDKEILSQVKNYLVYKNAFNNMVNSNLRLVVSLAKKYASISTVDILDLIGEGNIVLLKAVDGYSKDFNCRFSTYATTGIVRELRRVTVYEKTKKKNMVAYLKYNSIRKQVEDLEQELCRKLTPNEIMTRFNLSSKEYKFYESYLISITPIRLDSSIKLDDDTSYHEIVPSDDDVEEEATKNIFLDQIDFIVDKLPYNEREIINYRFGFNGYEQLSYRSISKKMGCSHEWVRNSEQKALKKLKKYLKSTDIKINQ